MEKDDGGGGACGSVPSTDETVDVRKCTLDLCNPDASGVATLVAVVGAADIERFPSVIGLVF